MKKKVFVVIFILLIISLLYLIIDNGDLLNNNNAAKKLIDEYEASFQRYTSVIDCIDSIEQYELNDGTVVVKVLDIKNCVDEIKNN